MKTKRSKSLSLIMAFVLLFSALFVNNAYAAGDGTIKITGAQEGKTFAAYKVFDLTKSGEANVSYTIADKWDAFFSGDGAGYIVDTNTGDLNQIIVDSQTKYINITDANVKEFAKKAWKYAGETEGITAAAKATVKKDETEATITGLDLGYYLVHPEGATKPTEGQEAVVSLTSAINNAQVNVKGTYPTIEKTVEEHTVETGHPAKFEITGNVPDTTGFKTYEYTITDVMTDGLTFNKDVAKLKVFIGGTEVTPGETTGVNAVVYADNGFTLTFDMTKFQTQIDAEVKVTYEAIVNEEAVVGTAENNSATLTYSNDPKDSDNKTTTPPDEEKVYNAKIVINKVDGKDKTTKLDGAEFVLYKGDGKGENYYKLENNEVKWVAEADATVVSTSDGVAEFTGLKNGTYHLKEVKAPEGYNLLTSPITVTVKATNNGTDTVVVDHTVNQTVENNSGSELPGTGGIGNDKLYMAGGVVILAAFVAFVVLRKRLLNQQ